MPILIEVSEDDPLSQGDILKDISLFDTNSDWAQQGGQAHRIKSQVCMVLSRPCAILYKPQIVVASIECTKELAPKGVNSFQKAKEYIEQFRDGLDSPDRFYLGQEIRTLGQSGRFFARLDKLHTIRLPDSDDLMPLLRSHRVATLADEFRRDLHRRIFSAFAAMGFDDYGWYTTKDLDWLITMGKKDLSPLDSEIREKEEVIKSNAASGVDSGNEAITAKVAKLRVKREEILRELAPYEEELATRLGTGQ